MRLLILIGIIYLIFRALKSWLAPTNPSRKTVFGKDMGEIADVMVKDPFCEVYFPKRNGIHQRVDGQDLYFCSSECRDKFMASQEHFS